MDEEIEDIEVKEDPEEINKSFIPKLCTYQYVSVGVAIAAVIIITIVCYNKLSATANCLICILAVFVPGYIGFYKYKGLDFLTVSRQRKRMKKYAYESEIPAPLAKKQKSGKKEKKEA